MSDNPLISVVMPCYNCVNYIAEAIDSILKQTLKEIELIIIDDNSTDGSLKIIKSFDDKRIRVIKHSPNKGISYTLNDGIKSAKADFIARMDADDISVPDRLEKQYKSFQANKKIAVVGTFVKVIDQDKNYVYTHINPISDSEIRKAFAYSFPIWPGSQMWRKTSLIKAGLFDENLPTSEDIELTLRICQVGKAENISEPLYIYRKNNSGDSNISITSHISRVMFSRKAFILKCQKRDQELNSLYNITINKYKSLRFEKGHKVPGINHYHYNINLALTKLIYFDKQGAKDYLNKAIVYKKTLLLTLFIIVIDFIPISIIKYLYGLNRIIKKYTYKYYAGDVFKYL